MSQCVEISSTAAISNPEPFLTRCLKAGVITLTLCTQGIDTLKMQAFPVNGKSVVCWNGLIFGASPVPLAVVPVFVVTRANTGRSPYRQGSRIPLTKSPCQLRQGSWWRRRNPRYCSAWSAHRAADRRCSPPAHGFCSHLCRHVFFQCNVIHF